MEFKFLTEKNDINIRLDVFLTQHTDLSRSQIKLASDQGRILLCNKRVKAGEKLKEGQTVLLNLEEKDFDIKPEDIKLDIVFENKDFAVINKAQGMVVHPAAGNWSKTLVNALLFHFKDNLSHNDNKFLRPGIVHRLDKNTSGLIIIAKNNKTHEILAKQIKDKKCQRIYIALLSGNLKEDEGEIASGFGRDKKNRKKMSVYPKGEGKEAVTKYKVIERFNGFCLVKFSLMTGRTHQIRVHSASLGHPVVGDALYGGNTKPYLKGQLLHSYKLLFSFDDKEYEFFAPLPDYFENVLKKCRSDI